MPIVTYQLTILRVSKQSDKRMSTSTLIQTLASTVFSQAPSVLKVMDQSELGKSLGKNAKQLLRVCRYQMWSSTVLNPDNSGRTTCPLAVLLQLASVIK